MKSFKFAGLSFLLGLSHVRVKKVRVRDREYFQYVIYLPKELAKKLYREAGVEEDASLHVVLLITPAKWYYLINWSEFLKHELNGVFKEILVELETLGLLPVKRETSVLIEVDEDELKKIGLGTN